ncbi:MAG: hypothetical protein ACRDQA_30985 [Nocardioidaceae bacterium]
MSIWDLLWIAWAAMFVGIEIPAAVNSTHGDTLSEHVWAWITHPHQGWHATVATWLGRAGVAALLCWLLGHFIAGWWTP